MTATRYYQFAGQTVAVRTGRGLAGVTSLVNDAHCTPVAAVPNKEQPDLNPVDRFHTDPFGAVRGNSGAATVPGDTQFLGKIRDASTGYTLLGARYYDETLGRFLTVDPILDLSDPQQWNGYAYANNNPVTLSDPSGLRPDEMTGKQWVDHQHDQAAAVSDPGSDWSIDDLIDTTVVVGTTIGIARGLGAYETTADIVNGLASFSNAMQQHPA
ncbi:RHS repeat-associated core domain-containing protein [Agromyces sp. H3Y2-19a]|uniref:RHS repeat-associated core domain-containing protein n=1 Tax=Agromyces chromiiresistens TaxID=3030835 RepID=UPI0023B8C0DC|nr:RHS repeat-associated core domain-containing protein [Agromyces chromiiresistens]MDF0514412.1 RHS repeat-associated core domain-containing protein [Agromyces chromiiresistens]